MAIRVSHTPISAYGSLAFQAGRGVAQQRQQEIGLQQQRMAMEHEARSRAFTLQEAAGRRAERSMMADIERRGRMDLAGFEEMKQQRQAIEQNMADWESLAGTMPEPEYRRGVISIRSGKTPQALRQERRQPTPKSIYRASDKDALFNMATEYAYAAPEAKGIEWGEPYRNQKDLIKQYKQFLVDNNYADLDTEQDKRLLELQWEEAMGSEKKFRWNPASPEVQAAREEMRMEPGMDNRAEFGTYLKLIGQDFGEKAEGELAKKWMNPKNRVEILYNLRKQYGELH